MKYEDCAADFNHSPPPEGKDLREQPTLKQTQTDLTALTTALQAGKQCNS